MVEQSGKLKLTVVAAHLKHDVDAGGKQDPFVKITYREDGHKTSVKKDAGKEPHWNETFDFDIKYIGDEIFFEVIDHNVLEKNEPIGQTKFVVSALCVHHGFDGWFEIHGKHGHEQGKIHLKSEWHPNHGGHGLLHNHWEFFLNERYFNFI